MPRKGPAPRRDILPDPKFRDLTVTKFVNMTVGKKGQPNGFCTVRSTSWESAPEKNLSKRSAEHLIM